MRHPRRLTALAAALFMLQYILLGSGVLCAMPAMGGMEGRGMTGMTRMELDHDQSRSLAHLPLQAPDHSQTPGSHEAPCHLPWAPTGCSTMAPCSPTALRSAPITVPPLPRLADGDGALVMLAPPSRITAPEPPPPRA